MRAILFPTFERRTDRCPHVRVCFGISPSNLLKAKCPSFLQRGGVIVLRMTAHDHINELVVPPPEVLGYFIRFQRGMMRWKQETLAVQAGVSLTTIERIERGETVSKASLEKVGRALGQQPGAFTQPRPKRSEQEALDLVVERFAWITDTVPVAVAPLRKERQLREVLNATTAFVDSDLSPEIDDDLELLRECMDFASWMAATSAGDLCPPPDRSFKKRRLYGDIFAHVTMMERKYRAVCLVGTYDATSNMIGFEQIKAGVIAFRSKDKNPAAIAIPELRAPPSIDLRNALREWLSKDD